jgi:phage terminase large subunit
MGMSFHISSEESPNVRAGRVVIPGLAGPDYPTKSRLAWGEHSAIYDVRVRGDFPRQGSDAVIGLGIVEDAVARWASTPAEGPLHVGIDPARMGDDESVIALRRGRKILSLHAFQGLDGIQLAGKAMEIIREARAPEDTERPIVKVDTVGVGSSPYDHLKQFDRVEIDLVDVSCGENADDEEHFNRLRDQLWFGLAMWLKEGGAIPDDTALITECIAPSYGFDARARIKVEPKEVTKEKLPNRRSPDRADAACLAVYSRTVGATGTTVFVTAPSFEDNPIGE